MRSLRAFILTTLFLSFSNFEVDAQDHASIILDADTGNEVDDFYALARILLEPKVNVTAVNATHWQTSHWAVEKSMENSHRLNQQLLGEMGIKIKTNRGGASRMYDWGDRAQHSAAAYEIIEQAKDLKEGQKLTIMAFGALTNVASAVYIAPSIASKLKLYWLGTTYDFEKGILNKNDFNCMMDPFAINFLLFSKAELHIMPVNTAASLVFEMETVKTIFKTHSLGNFLLNRWNTHLDGSRANRVIWDLALVNAYINPKWVEQVEIITSKDNGDRKVFYYKSIDADAMREDFFDKILAFKRPK
ncbi:MAG: nucleoside hydrolase [Bacteroidota bacterium]